MKNTAWSPLNTVENLINQAVRYRKKNVTYKLKFAVKYEHRIACIAHKVNS